MGRPADQHAREDLLTAAEREFVEHGVDGARVETIAKRANRAKGAFYLHFESKQAAFSAVTDRLIQSVLELVDPSPQGVPSGQDGLVALARRI